MIRICLEVEIPETKALHTQTRPTQSGVDKTELPGKKGVKQWPEFSSYQGIIYHYTIGDFHSASSFTIHLQDIWTVPCIEILHWARFCKPISLVYEIYQIQVIAN